MEFIEEFIEVQATFVVPADKADLFANRLSNVIHGFALYQLREQPYWYYGVWQNEWYGADPLSGDGVIAVGDVDKFSREKNASPSLDKESSHVRSNIARKIHLAMSKRAKAVKKIPLDLPPSDGGGFVQKVNVGVAKHVITRKHYPDPRCKTLCTMMNTDYCRLKCDQDRLEPLD